MPRFPKIHSSHNSRSVGYPNLLDDEQQQDVKLCAIESSNKSTKLSQLTDFFSRPKDRSKIYKIKKAEESCDHDVNTGDCDVDEDLEKSDSPDDVFRKSFLSSETRGCKKRKKWRAAKSASFDYTLLDDEEDFSHRMSSRRTAICAKSRDSYARQLETFIVISRLKNFDLL